MRFLGVLLFVLGGGGTAFATWASYQRGRPQDVLFGLLAPVAMLVTLTGLLLAFVPDFFG
ncbi:hypothetical protein [Haliangium ochraceum]|uniref:Uncharacterized protein n=1 Tax=Haliangium ochraceum (strain DSM 14365 / JCM 11303 / SMP-2) TaxID=502025 RepID=D0LIU1_HALO1|nr:hypothetical protein [Haliangium ochraceum]ACY12970.1 conserved hypothetical protein [Haliangium ochraceum DSM 14365]